MKDTNYYTKTGKGPNLVLLHGWRNDRTIFDNILPELSKDYTCWTLDLPGFGENPRPSSTWDIKKYAAYVEKFIESHNIISPIVLGHSFGGRIAVVLAAADPEVKKVILYATPGVRQPLPRFTNIAHAMYKSLGRTTSILNKSLVMRRIKKKFSSTDYQEAENLKDIFIATINFQLETYMAKIKQPVLLVWGENDTVIPVKIAKAMQQILPSSEIVTIPGAGHTAHLENPRLFCGYIRKFIDEQNN